MLWIVGCSLFLEACDASIVHNDIKTAIRRQNLGDDIRPVNLFSNIEMSVHRVRALYRGTVMRQFAAPITPPI